MVKRKILESKTKIVGKQKKKQNCPKKKRQTGNPPCFKNFVITITSILSLWEELRSTNIPFLKTKNLNQDPLENFFCTVRQRGGFNFNPTAQYFRRTFQHIFLSSDIIDIVSNKSNCLADKETSLIMPLKDSVAQGSSDSHHPLVSSNPTLISTDKYDLKNENDVMEADIKEVLDHAEKIDIYAKTSLQNCSLFYYTSFIIRKTVEKFKCRECKNILSGDFSLAEEDELLIKFKQKPGRDPLYPPSEKLKSIILKQNQFFVRRLPEILTCKGILKTLENEVMAFTENFDPDWYKGECQKHQLFFLHCWLRIRLLFAIKWISQKNKQEKKEIRKAKRENKKNKNEISDSRDSEVIVKRGRKRKSVENSNIECEVMKKKVKVAAKIITKKILKERKASPQRREKLHRKVKIWRND